MYRSVMTALLGLSVASAFAQMTPVGLWKTISDKDGSVTSEVRIIETNGVLSGKIVRDLGPKAKPTDKCIECKDDRKDQPIAGLEIVRDAKKIEGRDVWEGGTVVDPNDGKIYKLKMTPIDGGKKLEFRGFIGFALLGRTQVWIRVE
jgi:uncharacterized protein (DUF2147 family)